MSLLRARKGPRTILGLLAALGLVAALAMPALATHVEPELIEGNDNKTCGELGEYGFEFKINETPSGFYDEDDPAVVVTPDEPTDFEVTITYNADNTFSFSANIAVEAVFVKGGNDGGNLYEYDPPVTSDSGLQTPSAQEVSHVSFCWTNAPQESEAPPSEPAESTPASEAPPSEPAESEPVEESEAPAESQREGELGGTPTPAPSSGDLPDTAIGDFGQMPATVLSLVLIGALAAMVYARLARQR